MHLTFDDVNDAFYSLVAKIHDGTLPARQENSRNGDVLVVDQPVIVTYRNPRQRVLFNTSRDANPFFHLFESLWMLAGSNLVDPLAFYASNMRNYSDDGKTLNGAYGYRWRKHYVDADNTDSSGILYGALIDQLQCLVKHLKSNPTSRRAVLQMWNVEDDLLKMDTSRDVSCNLSVCFSIRKEVIRERSDPDNAAIGTYCKLYLDMTVFNRSNDLIWGMLGANVVHFSMLQEYVANCLGVEVGLYHQVTNNLHVYLNNWKPAEWLAANTGDSSYPPTTRLPLVEDRERFDTEVRCIVERCPTSGTIILPQLREPWLASVALPMLLAFAAHKDRNYDMAYYWLSQVEAPDWKRAGIEWVRRRSEAWKLKQQTEEK